MIIDAQTTNPFEYLNWARLKRFFSFPHAHTKCSTDRTKYSHCIFQKRQTPDSSLLSLFPITRSNNRRVGWCVAERWANRSAFLLSRVIHNSVPATLMVFIACNAGKAKQNFPPFGSPAYGFRLIGTWLYWLCIDGKSIRCGRKIERVKLSVYRGCRANTEGKYWGSNLLLRRLFWGDIKFSANRENGRNVRTHLTCLWVSTIRKKTFLNNEFLKTIHRKYSASYK